MEDAARTEMPMSPQALRQPDRQRYTPQAAALRARDLPLPPILGTWSGTIRIASPSCWTRVRETVVVRGRDRAFDFDMTATPGRLAAQGVPAQTVHHRAADGRQRVSFSTVARSSCTVTRFAPSSARVDRSRLPRAPAAHTTTRHSSERHGASRLERQLRRSEPTTHLAHVCVVVRAEPAM
jgi:hypothetical protein